MNELQIYNNDMFGEVRILVIDGNPWFGATDVAKALGYGNPRTAIASHCKTDGVQNQDVLDSRGCKQQIKIINEGNLYRLILRSTLPTAERFEKWVVEEVLPSIRKTGTYLQQPMTAAQILAGQAQLLVTMEQQLTALDTRTHEVEAKVDKAIATLTKPNPDHWKEDINTKIKAIVKASGMAEFTARGILYASLEKEAACDIAARLRRLKLRMKQAGATYKAWDAATKLDAIAQDKHLKLLFEGIVRQYQAKYCG